MSKILVIEDQEIIRENVRELLEQKDYIVETAMTASRGYELANSFLPDLILCDLLLPDYSGIDFLKKLKKNIQLKDIPVIIITGQSQKEIFRNAMTQGADDFIVKPFKAKELFDGINSQLLKSKIRKLDFSLIAELSEQSPLPILRIDKEGKIIYSNPAAGFLNEKEMIEKLMTIIASKQIDNFEFEFPVGEKIFNCIASFNSAQYYHNLYFIDNTVKINAFRELENKNALIERKNQNLSQFTYIVAHDLKAPVINLRQLLDLILQEQKQKFQDNDKNNVLLNFLNDSLGKLETVIEDVSSLLKSREESTSDQKIDFSVANSVKIAVSEFDEILKKIDAKVTYRIDDSIQLYFPKKQFSKILYNLIDNAIKFRDPNRPLIINFSASKTKDEVKLKIKDNGLGFDEKIAKKKLFVLYQKMHDKIEGKGLGLQLIRNILENYNGEIQFNSEPGVGTVFELIFKN